MDLITQRLSVKDIGLPKWAKDALKKSGVKSEGATLIRKGISPEDTKFNKGERSSVDYITTKTVDRDGDIVVPNGAVLDHYRNNPVVLFAHDYASLPIGKSLWIKTDEKGLISKTQYAKHAQASDIFEYRKSGFPMAKSIGFIPLEVIEREDFGDVDIKSLGLEETDLKDAQRIFPKWLMLEYSDVPVPSNPDALQLAISKGIMTMDEAKKRALEDRAFVIEIIDEDPLEKEIADSAEEELITIEKRYEVGGIEESTDAADEKVVEVKMPETIRFKKIDGIKEPWCKALDIEGLEVPPSTVLYDIASKWLDCEIKDIFVHEVDIAPYDLGSKLSGLDEALKGYDEESVRNFNHYGTESPLIYSIIQLNSEKTKDFLVSGTGFYSGEKGRIMIQRSPNYFGLTLTFLSSFSEKEASVDVVTKMVKWAEENNFLKGESFALNGQFLKKTDDGFSDIFLSDENISAVKKTAEVINKKGKDAANRGVIFMGPPGTGKTLSGRVLMNNIDSTFIWVSARDFTYSGAIGGLVRSFSLARKLAPSMLFIEDIDNWLSDHATDLLKTEMDGISKSTGVITILTTNYPERLPKALIDRPGRFHDVLYFSLPDSKTRERMIKRWCGEESVVEKSVMEKTVEDTEGFSGAHMYELIAFAKSLMEDDEELKIGDAILLSIKKLNDQRQLISEVQAGKKSFTDTADKDSIKDVEGETIEKEGRVLSKKTVSVIKSAAKSVTDAAEKLNDLVSIVESNPEDQDEKEVSDVVEKEAESSGVDIVEKIADDIGQKFFDVDEEKLQKAVTGALKDALSSSSIDVGGLVRERLALAKGELF
jgi:DNA polymerase III delta prime subunit